MEKYKTLRNNKPLLSVKKDSREVVFTTISAMCDNVGKLTLRKNEHGDFRLSGNGYSLSNWQMEYDKQEIEWEADEQNWSKVINMINTGTSVIEKVVSR